MTLLAAFWLLAALPFSQSKTLAVQIALDHRGFSCNAIDGQWGEKSRRAAAACWGAEAGKLAPEALFDRYVRTRSGLFATNRLTRAELDALVRIPAEPAAKAKLDRLGYESAQEMLAERGHLSMVALSRLNPGVNWEKLSPGAEVVVPAFPAFEDLLAAAKKSRKPKISPGEVTEVRVSLSRCEIRAFDSEGKLLMLLPCSIARDKAKAPKGELKVKTIIANPNYTYTPERGDKSRYIYPEGPNNPVGLAWIGLNLPSYGIHGTPNPHTIGRAESHGCFRLANWNILRLAAAIRPEARITVDE